MVGIFPGIPNVLEIIVIAAGLSLLTTYVYKFLTDQAVMHEMKAEIDRLKKKMKQHRRDPEEMQAIQKKMMPLNMKYLKMSMKPTLITLLPFLLIFMGLSAIYGEVPVVMLPWDLPIIGTSLEWIGTYIISSVILTTVFRKVLKVA
tara:strand:+ start:980 stop:1417 length:438 start_codon:yes stop_codon:yes gene_type:complete